MPILCEDENALKRVRWNEHECRRSNNLNLRDRCSAREHRCSVAVFSQQKSKHHWDISAFSLPVLSAPQRGWRSIRFWIYIFLSRFQPHSTLGGKVKGHQCEEVECALSVSHLATAWQTSRWVLLTPPACRLCFFQAASASVEQQRLQELMLRRRKWDSCLLWRSRRGTVRIPQVKKWEDKMDLCILPPEKQDTCQDGWSL